VFYQLKARLVLLLSGFQPIQKKKLFSLVDAPTWEHAIIILQLPLMMALAVIPIVSFLPCQQALTQQR
jgi:hypothetical protein